MRALEGLSEVSAFLSECGITDPRKEAELIVSDYAGVGKVALYRDNPVLSSDQENEIKKVLQRRQGREPLQYIAGFTDFFGLRIKVGPGVLIPRPETELIVEEAVKAVTRNAFCVTGEGKDRSRVTHHALRILDLCTGSGCLALALAKGIPGARVFGTDISDASLDYASMNGKINGLEKVIFKKGNLFDPVHGLKFDLIVSNPPYIRKPDIDNLAPEIRSWEPIAALDGGEDGLQFYRKILFRSIDYLVEGGSLFLELGQDQAAAVAKIAEDAGLIVISLIRDYAGIERVMHLKSA